MAEVVPTTRTQAMRLAIVITGSLVSFNSLFYLLSKLWFEDHHDSDLAMIRVAFLILTALVAGASFGAALAPRAIGHLLSLATGVAALVGGIAALTNGLPGVMGVTLMVLGVMTPVLAFYSFQQSRAAWSVLVAILVVFSAVSFFGAPKVRGVLHIGLWTALIAPGLMIIAVIALAMVRGEYRERS
jgi:hypothetical protein